MSSTAPNTQTNECFLIIADHGVEMQEVSSADALYCFEVFSANRRSYLLQAEGPDELKSWVMSIRRTIESQV